MALDALAAETHFLDHLAPVWRALRPELRGRFLVDQALADRAERLGIEAEVIDALEIRRLDRHPTANPGPGPSALVASYGDTKVARRLGFRRFAFLEHGAGQSYGADRRNGRHGSYAGGEDRGDVGLFLVPNAGSARRWSEAYPSATVEAIGSPRLDVLPPRTIDPIEPWPVVAISFHWDCHLVPETRSAVGHYLPALPELARRFHLLGHGHPRNAERFRRIYRRHGIEWVPDFDEVSRRADVYVCDNSSTLFEFAATGRPVVVLNAPWYRRDRHHELRFWEAASVGVNVDEPGDLGDAISRALEERPEDVEAREAALRIAYAVRDGATRRAADAIERWLGGGEDGEGPGTVEAGPAPA